MEQINISIFDVRLGETTNWLIFEARVGRLDNHRIYSFAFCGTELNHSLSLLDSDIENLREQLYNDFGYPPFDIQKAKRILGTGKEYILIRGKASD